MLSYIIKLILLGIILCCFWGVWEKRFEAGQQDMLDRVHDICYNYGPAFWEKDNEVVGCLRMESIPKESSKPPSTVL